MAYRRTERIQARLDATREQLVASTLYLLGAGGWAAVTVNAVAADAGVATGTVYRHVPTKDALCLEAFRRAAGRELDQVRAALHAPDEEPLDRLESGLRIFAGRALQRPRLAYALLSEPAGAAVEADRLAHRARHRDAFRDVLAEAVDTGDLAPHDPSLVAAVLVGSMGEALVGPLATVTPTADADRTSHQVDQLVAACLRALPHPRPGPDGTATKDAS